MYLHELKVYRKSTMIWIVALVGLLLLFLSFFPSLSRDAEAYKQLLEGYPEELRKAIGLSVDSLVTMLGLLLVCVWLCKAMWSDSGDDDRNIDCFEGGS